MALEQKSDLPIYASETYAPIDGRYTKVIEYINNKAPDFYGTRVLSPSPMARMRIIYHALMMMPNLNLDTKIWLESFNAEKATRMGNVAMHKEITIQSCRQSDNTSKQVPAISAFREDAVLTAVLNDLASRDDPSSFVISQLDMWRRTQPHQPPINELLGAQRCFEQVLFAIHRSTLPQYLETFINSPKIQMDTPTIHELAL